MLISPSSGVLNYGQGNVISTHGTILPGGTRKSSIHIAPLFGCKVEPWRNVAFKCSCSKLRKFRNCSGCLSCY
ncbi:hypothetical protein Pint_33575 [Pistacia integerrima]|uniref:Uncharacterized protein n=1 Tax=Pistacia integerrima TaxID=434235 RepID=A0ACC0X412_9ROSI|nr:hypothetical protein Pint_33575 [Pistacia integerrima]